mgnify:CR=1 FL=1
MHLFIILALMVTTAKLTVNHIEKTRDTAACELHVFSPSGEYLLSQYPTDAVKCIDGVDSEGYAYEVAP